MRKKVVLRFGRRYVLAKQRIELTPGEVIRELRQLKGWTQEELAQRSRICAQNISMLENNRVPLGRKRALQLADVFGIHPGTLMFPGYVRILNHQVA